MTKPYRDIITCFLLDFLKAGFHSLKELDLEEFIVDLIPALLPFCVNQLDFRFLVSIWNPAVVRSDLKPICLPSRLFHFLISMWLGIQLNLYNLTLSSSV